MISKGELLNIYFDKQDADLSRYPLNLPFFNAIDKLRIHPQVTYFVGENGTGKSTLLEAIAIASGFNAEGGSRNFNFNTRESHSELYRYMRTSRGTRRHTDGFFLRSESFYNVATEIEKLDLDEENEVSSNKITKAYGGTPLHERSHGESFWAVFMNRFFGNGLYILDEPEAALSPTKQMAMLIRMDELINQRSQFIIATHAPILLAYPDSLIYEFTNTGIQVKKYEQTELVSSYRDFFNNPEYLIKQLLNRG